MSVCGVAVKSKSLKVTRKFLPGGRLGKDKMYPMLVLSGKWLEDSGIFEGQSVSVVMYPDGILICPAEKLDTKESKND